MWWAKKVTNPFEYIDLSPLCPVVAVVNPERADFLKHHNVRFHDYYAAGRRFRRLPQGSLRLKYTALRNNAGFLPAEMWSRTLRHIKPTLLNHPKHIAHILDHDPGDVGDGVDVVFGVVGEAGAGHEV